MEIIQLEKDIFRGLVDPERLDYLYGDPLIFSNGYNPRWYDFHLVKLDPTILLLMVTKKEDYECNYECDDCYLHRVMFENNKIKFQDGPLLIDTDIVTSNKWCLAHKAPIWVET